MSDMMIGLWSQKSSSEVTKSLIVIHNNVISNKQIVHTYCNDGLLKGLIHLCHSSNDQLVLSLAVSLIQHICSCGDQYIEMFFNLSGATPVLAMMAAGTNTDKSITALNQMLLLHEQAAKLICLITAKSQKYLKELVRHGVIEKVVTLSSVFLPESPHKNCCFDRHAFTETDISLTKQLLEGRKLVGKIYLDESSSQEGELSILMVDLFDTTTSVDVHINEELIKLGVAWPDLRKKENIRAVSHAEVWADFNVTKVVDVNCFWAFIDSDAPNKIDKISDLIEDYIYASNICSIDNLISGVKVSVPLPTSSKKCKWLRGCVMEKDAECCLVLLVDYGHVVKIYADQLFPLPGFITEIPYQANLCLLKGIQVPPKYPIVLQHAAEILCNISTKFRLQVHAAGGTEALIKLCHLPDKNILIKAAAGLTNLSHNFIIRKEIGVLGGTQYILEMCHENMNNDELLTNLLTCLLNLITKCFSNRKIIADANGLLWLIKIYQSSFTSLNNKNLLLTVMKNLIRYGWRLIDPMNVPDVRSIIEGNVGRLKGCFGLQKICNDEVLNAVRERKSKRVLHKGEASSDPTCKSLTIKDMMNKFVERSDSGYKTETDGEDIYLVPMLTEKEVVLTDKSLDSKSIKGSNGTSELSEYCFQQILNVKEDSKNAFFFSPDVQNIKTSSISNTICALLNSSEGGVIYVGVDVAARIIGIKITRRERDNIRLGIDDLCERHTPKIRHDKYEIHFIPVMKNSSIQGNTQHEERFIVEVRIGKNIDGTLYQTPTKKMLFRQGAKNVERSIQQIREMTIRQEELKYQAEIKALRLMLREVKSQLKT